MTILSARLAAANQLKLRTATNIQLKAANSSLMKVNGELLLTVTTAIEPVTATVHTIVSEDIHDDCLISRADLELLEIIPQGFPNARVPRLRPIFRKTQAPKVEKTNKCRSVQESTVDRIYQDYKDTMSCLLYTSPSPRDLSTSRMPSSA